MFSGWDGLVFTCEQIMYNVKTHFMILLRSSVSSLFLHSLSVSKFMSFYTCSVPVPLPDYSYMCCLVSPVCTEPVFFSFTFWLWHNNQRALQSAANIRPIYSSTRARNRAMQPTNRNGPPANRLNSFYTTKSMKKMSENKF